MSRIVLLTLVCSAALAAAQYDTPAPWELNPCMTVRCSAGMVCEASNGKAGCVKAPTIEPYPVTLNACAATSCLVGTICVDEGGVGKCVAPPGSENNNCTVKFEEWKQCASCEPTCEVKMPFCNRMCQPARCQCQQGYFRNKEGQCVTENDCDTAAMTPSPLTCSRKNEEYRECATACEPSCKNKDTEMLCIAMCKPPACQCKAGFFRADNGECVTAKQCTRSRDPPVTTPSSSQCKKNEGFSSCSSMCEPQCGQYEPMACIMMCGPPKCQCTSGFYRNANGECMSRQECDSTPSKPVCKKNQIFSECSSVCVPKCGDYEVRPCMAMCGAPKCECDRGFYMDNHGECVTRQECEAQSSTVKTPSQADCNPNEKFTECSTLCEEKCGEALTRACPASCGPAKCQCEFGFLRNSVGDCVSKSDCDLDTPFTCENTDCVSGFNCKMENGKPTCVAGNNVTCAGIECDVGHHCEILGPPTCIPDITCANIDCRSGMICEMKNRNPTCVNKEKLTCNTVKCAGGHRCEISPEGTPSCIPMITCANVRCAGPCKDTPTGPQCGPRPLILPISAGPSSTPTPACGVDEERRFCGNPCWEPFCGDELVDLHCSLTAECRPSACECKQGFVRDRNTKRCIRREQCLSSSDPCARKNCGIAMGCINLNGRAKCVSLYQNKPMADSVAASTSSISTFHPFPSPPDSCEKVKCLNGGTCVMEEVTCVSGPCKRVPKCRGGSAEVADDVPSVDPDVPSEGFGSVYQPFADNCGQLQCKQGEECTMETIPCFAAPCKKGAVCRPANTICHKEHEVWDQCFHGCGSSCQIRDQFCTEQCGPGGCICDTFYIRDEVSGNCVRLEDCPSDRAVPIQKPRALTIDSFYSYSNDAPISPIAPPPPPTCQQLDCPIGEMCIMPPMKCPVPPCTRRPTCVKNPNFLPGDEIVPTCDGHSCPAGEKCQLQQVQCIRAPCYPIPDCVKDPNYLPGDEIVPTCDGHSCPVGQKCQLKQVLCYRAPCYPIPDCVIDMVPPSCTLPCPYGMTCVLETVFCKKAPCPQKPSCRLLQVDPVPSTCAAVTCSFGETCVLEPLPCFAAPCPNRAICRPTVKSCKKKNEIWSQCFTGCEASCQTRNQACTLQCGPGGCQCNSGYIRNKVNGECVLESACPRGQQTCDGVYCRRDMQCEMRRGVPVCIPRPANDHPFPMGTMPPTVTCETLGCQPGEKCVQKIYGPQCEPATTCSYTEEYDRCFHGCEATCAEANPFCTKQCGPGGCKCRSGFVRDPTSNQCVQQAACPNNIYG